MSDISRINSGCSKADGFLNIMGNALIKNLQGLESPYTAAEK